MLSSRMFFGRRPHSPTDSSRWVQSSHRSLSTWRALGHLVLPPKTTRKSRFWSNHCKMSTCKIFVPNSSKMNTCDLKDLNYLQNEQMQKKRGEEGAYGHVGISNCALDGCI